MIDMRFWGGVIVAAVLTAALAQSGAAAQSGDAMQKRLRACTSCHGGTAIDIDGGYVPRIQGKPAGYLFNQLVNFREHRRNNATMNYLTSHLSDDYLYRMAEYFAGREAPYPEPAPPPEASAADRGEELVRRGDPDNDIPACQSCHGDRLAGVQPATPGLIGLPRHYILAQLGAWRVGTRHAKAPDCMAKVAGRLTERDIEAVAAWLASQPLPADTRPQTEPVVNPPLKCGVVPRPGG
ncbi:MAG: c-type cytochrome [Ectothiorhodospiraceae bacterium]|jgi:cytochrome c553